jgi:hypothetical protein
MTGTRTIGRIRRPALLGAVMGVVLPLAAFAATSLVRITSEQYRRTIEDVFGPTIQVEENAVAPGFRDEGLLALGTRKLTFSSAELETYEALAQSVGTQISQTKRRATFLQCEPKSEERPDEACAGPFIERVGLHLFRRPLTKDELAEYVAIHRSAAEKNKSFNAGVAAAVGSLLVSPEFLFRVERTLSAKEGAADSLDAWSRASRLSFFLWNSTPDAPLLAAAKSGALMTPAGLEKQVDRMLKSPRLEHGMRAFFSDMLGFDAFATLGIDANLYPRFTKHVHEDAQEQTLRTIVDHLLVRNRDYRDLLTTRDTFLTPSLAALYGVPLPRSKEELGGAVSWVPYTFPPQDPRVGLMSHASFLSLNSHPGTTSPTLRGKALREKLLCQKVPPPPGNVDFSIVQNTEDPRFKTVRQRLTAHRKDAMCAGCHRVTDPIGLSLEQFDTASQFRTMENGAPIDVSGELNGKNFEGLAALAGIIRDDPAASNCLVQRVYSYGTQRKPTDSERAWLKALPKELADGPGLRWRDLMRRVATNPEFYAAPVSGTVTAQSH